MLITFVWAFWSFIHILLWSKCSGPVPIFKIWIVFLLLNSINYLYVLDILRFLWTMIKFNSSTLLWQVLFNVLSKMVCLPRVCKDILLCFFSRSFIVLVIQKCDPSWINFWECCEAVVKLHFLWCKECLYSIELPWQLFLKINWPKYIWVSS